MSVAICGTAAPHVATLMRATIIRAQRSASGLERHEFAVALEDRPGAGEARLFDAGPGVVAYAFGEDLPQLRKLLGGRTRLVVGRVDRFERAFHDVVGGRAARRKARIPRKREQLLAALHVGD